VSRPADIVLASGVEVPHGYVEVFALVGYEKPRSRNYSCATYALHPDDLPHGAWVGQNYAKEKVLRLAVPEASGTHIMAVGSSRNRQREAMEESARAFADVAHDNGGMVRLYDLLEQHTELWATGMPADTPRERATVFMFACINALAGRMKHVAEDLIAHDVSLPWGEA
jgi:hypothetical protein